MSKVHNNIRKITAERLEAEFNLTEKQTQQAILILQGHDSAIKNNTETEEKIKLIITLELYNSEDMATIDHIMDDLADYGKLLVQEEHFEAPIHED
jgi:hypothetical protein